MMLNTIHLGNFFELYQQIQPGSVHLFLSDLPYGCLIDKRLKNVPDCKIDLFELEKSLDYLLTRNGTALLFCDLELLIELRQTFRKYLEYRFNHILIKTLAMPTSKTRPINDVEYLAVFKRKNALANDITFNPFESGIKGESYKKKNYDPGISIRKKQKPEFDINTNGKRWIRTAIPMTSKSNMTKSERFGISHPFLKSLKLLRMLIKVYSQSEALVCDGFAGSGSTLISAYLENRRSVGFEIDRKYFDEAEKRIKNTVSQGRLF